MGLLSLFREMMDGGGTSDDRLMKQELEQVRRMAEEAERASQAEGEGQMERDTPLGPKIRRRYQFVGSVQGVGFRWTTTNLASSAGATGWVRNESDGSVTAEIQGIREQIDAVIEGLDRYYNGSRWMGGFTISSAHDVPLVDGELDFHPKY